MNESAEGVRVETVGQHVPMTIGRVTGALDASTYQQLITTVGDACQAASRAKLTAPIERFRDGPTVPLSLKETEALLAELRQALRVRMAAGAKDGYW